MVQQAILKMKNNKSAGNDKLPVILFKKLCSQLSYPLSLLFNISLSTSDLPAAWKSSIVVPVFKKGSSNDPSNYRPISLTAVACKILESIVKDNVLNHLV